MSNYNPYAYTSTAGPPQASPAPHGAPQPWQVGEVFGHAWRVFKPAWATLVFTQLLAGILGGVPNYIPAVLVATQAVAHGSSEYWIVYSVCTFLGLLVSTFFNAGLVKVWCAAARGQNPEFGDMFSGGRYFLPLLGTVFLMTFAILLGYLLLIVPGILLALGLAFAQFYVVDQNKGPIDALKTSWEATKGHKAQIFLFGLVSILLAIGGYLACCVGILVALPVIMVAWATIYTRISGTAVDFPATAFEPPQGPPGGGYGGYGPPGGGYGPPGGGYGPPGGGYGPPGGSGYGPPGGGSPGGYGSPPGGFGER